MKELQLGQHQQRNVGNTAQGSNHLSLQSHQGRDESASLHLHSESWKASIASLQLHFQSFSLFSQQGR